MCQLDLVVPKFEKIRVSTHVIMCLIGPRKCNHVYRVVSCFRWVVVEFHKNNMTSCRFVLVSYYSLLCRAGPNMIQKHELSPLDSVKGKERVEKE